MSSKFEKSSAALVVKILPRFLAGMTVEAREHITQAFVNYFCSGGHNEASDLVKARFEFISKVHNIKDLRQISRMEVAGALGLISNTIPACFWILYHVVSDPALLAECMAELESCIQKKDDINYLDIKSIRTSCPTLTSTSHEVLRFYGVQLSVRKVVEDHMLDEEFFLKKDSYVIVPSAVQHFGKSLWGMDVDKFDPKRFMRAAMSGNASKNIGSRVGFHGFGGGRHLCPGRHFAMAEIMSFVALIVLQFDITPVKGVWAAPKSRKLSSMGTTTTLPDHDLDIILTPRAEQKALFVVR